MGIIDQEMLGNKQVYLHGQEDRVYRRIVGGLAWPYPGKPGFLVVVAENFKEERQSGQRLLWVLAEKEAETIQELRRACRELTDTYLAGPWYGDPSQRAMVRHLNLPEPHEDRRDSKRLIILSAPYRQDPQALHYYLQLLGELVRTSQKTLFFGPKSRVPGYILNLLNLPPEALAGKLAEQPPIAALGYAASALRLRQPYSQAIPVSYLPKEKWDPYGRP